MKLLIKILVVVLIGVVASIILFQNNIKQEVVSQGIQKTITEVTNIDEDTVNEVMSQIPEEDQQTLIEIASEHVNVETVQSVLSSENKEEAIEYVKQQLSSEEINQLLEVAVNNQSLLDQYGVSLDDILSYVQQ